MTNVVVWPRLAERQRRELLTSTLLTVYGNLIGQIVTFLTDLLREDEPEYLYRPAAARQEQMRLIPLR